jgi:uncharacterized protein
MSTDRLQAMFAQACFGDDEAAFDDLGGFLAGHGIPEEDREAILAAPRRLGLYRKLVRANVTGVIETMLAQTKARLDARLPGELERTMALFLAQVGPRTPHLRDVPSEFLSFAAPKWRSDTRLPRWLATFAELELADFTIGVAPRPGPPPPVEEVTAERPLVFGEPKRLLRLDWAVHVVPPDDLTVEPEERTVTILVYRDSAHRTRYLELTPLAAAILERLFAGDPLGGAMVTACQVLAHPLDDEVLAGAARLLADLGERGVLLGGRAQPEV